MGNLADAAEPVFRQDRITPEANQLAARERQDVPSDRRDRSRHRDHIKIEEGTQLRKLGITTLTLFALALIGIIAGSAAAQGTPTADNAPANLAPPEGSVLLFELRARGVQIYACEANPDDTSAFIWTFKAPEAELLNRRGEVAGQHFAGPTWQGFDGSAVVGEVLERADSPDSGSIPWLLLEAKEHVGSGAFSTITFVQRLDTSGGAAPAEGCDADHAGDEVRQPYEATYAFYYPSAPATPDAATPAA
jgi:Protein of unknown function (DUF3455)